MESISPIRVLMRIPPASKGLICAPGRCAAGSPY